MPVRLITLPIDGLASTGVTYEGWMFGAYAQRARSSGILIRPPLTITMEGPAIQAHIHANHWVAVCDQPGCQESETGKGDGVAPQMVWLDLPRFMCGGCWNVHVNGDWRMVDMPDSGDRQTAEAVLGQRPDPLTRNWMRHQGETVEDLMLENRSRGVHG